MVEPGNEKRHVSRPTRPARPRDQRGVVLAEFALVLPVLAMVLCGIASGGSAYEQKLSITHAAEQGGRVGSSLAQDQAFSSGTWATNIRQIVIQRAAGDLNAAGSSVCVSLVEGSSPNVVVVGPASSPPTANPASSYTTNLGSDGATPTPCDSNETYPTSGSDQGRRVQIRVSRPSRLEAVVFSSALTLTASVTSRYELITS